MAFKRWGKILVVVLLTTISAYAANENDKFILVIDAGHGGNDPGALGTYSKEKNINLNVALEFGRLVETNCKDVKVVYTRKTDVAVELKKRAEIANRAKADLFISIHTNALPKGRTAYGAETYTLGMARSSENLDVAKRENSAILVEDNYRERYASFNPNSSESYIIFEFMQDEYMKQSVSLAKSIQKHYVNIAGRQNKGVHQAGFLVLRETSMPSVLTELGFITTPAEEAYLNTDNGINKMARSIYEGFLDYKQTQDGKKRATPPYKDAGADIVTTKETVVNDTVAVQSETGTPIPQQKTNANDDDGIIIISDPAPRDTSLARQSAGESVLGSRFGGKETANGQSSDKTERKIPAQAVERTSTSVETSEDSLTFKIQFLTSDTPLKANDKRLRDFANVESYAENNLVKYTCLSTSDYSEAAKNQKEVRLKYPDAFIVAFKGNQRMNLSEAIRLYKSRKQ